MSIMPDNLTECGRVYLFISKENANFFVINCLFCNKDYSEWLQFFDHLNYVHELEDVNAKEQSQYDDSIPERHNLKTNKLEAIQLEEKLPHNNRANSKYLDHNLCNNQLDECILPLKNEVDCTNIEILDEYLNETIEYYKNVSINVKNKPPKTINSCFFGLYTTDNKIMLKFIELLRQHPYQWTHKRNDFTIKEKRINSTLNLTKQINKNFNINITPRGTRASILSLLRWFNREYIRYLNCQRNNFQFVSMQNEYFDKLLEFLPHQHLKSMTCDECSKHFKSEHLLMAHKHKYHNGQVPFRCRYCGHGFIHQSSHKIHENRHTKIQIWPCKICRYQAISKSDYIKHVATTHSPHQPHKCSICGLAYKTKSNLNVHLKSHSLPEYECEFCKKKFYEKYRYKRHIWQHEERETCAKSIDNFTCDLCGRRFTSNKTLMKHQLVHIQENYKTKDDFYKLTDVIVYYCGYCSLEFAYKEAFETHMHLKHNART